MTPKLNICKHCPHFHTTQIDMINHLSCLFLIDEKNKARTLLAMTSFKFNDEIMYNYVPGYCEMMPEYDTPIKDQTELS